MSVVLLFKLLSILFSYLVIYLLSTYPSILNNLLPTIISSVFNADMEINGAKMETIYSQIKKIKIFFLSKTLQTQE